MYNLENSFLTAKIKEDIYKNEKVKQVYDYYCDLVKNIPINRGNTKQNQILVDSMFAITLEFGKTYEVFENIKNNFARIDEFDLIHEYGERFAGLYSSKDDKYTTAKVVLNTAKVNQYDDEFRILIHEMIHAASIKEQTYENGYIHRTTGIGYDKWASNLNEIITEDFATKIANEYFGISRYAEFNFGKDNDFVYLNTKAWGYSGIANYSRFVKDFLNLYNFNAEEMYFRIDESQQDLDMLGKLKNVSILLGNINDAYFDEPDKNVTIYYDKLNTQIIELLINEMNYGKIQNIPEYINFTKKLSKDEGLSEIIRRDTDLLLENADSIIDNNLRLLDAYLFFEKIAPSMGKTFDKEHLNNLYSFIGSFEFDDIRRREDLNIPKPKSSKEYQIYDFLAKIRDLRELETIDSNKIDYLLKNIPDIDNFNQKYNCNEFADKSALLLFKESESLRDDMIKASMGIDTFEITKNDFTYKFVASFLYKSGYLDALLDSCLEQREEFSETAKTLKDSFYEYLLEKIDLNEYNNQILFNDKDIHQKNVLDNVIDYDVFVENVFEIINNFTENIGTSAFPDSILLNKSIESIIEDLLTSTKNFNGIERTPFELAIDNGDYEKALRYKELGDFINIDLKYSLINIRDYLDDEHDILKYEDLSFSKELFLNESNLKFLELFIKQENNFKIVVDKMDGIMGQGLLECMKNNSDINDRITFALIDRIKNCNELHLIIDNYINDIKTTGSIIECFCSLSDDMQKKYSKELLNTQMYTVEEIEQKFIEKGYKVSNISYDIDTLYLNKKEEGNIKQNNILLDLCVHNLESIMTSDRKETLSNEQIKRYTHLLLDCKNETFTKFMLDEKVLHPSIKEEIKEYSEDFPNSFIVEFKDLILNKENENTNKIQFGE